MRRFRARRCSNNGKRRRADALRRLHLQLCRQNMGAAEGHQHCADGDHHQGHDGVDDHFLPEPPALQREDVPGLFGIVAELHPVAHLVIVPEGAVGTPLPGCPTALPSIADTSGEVSLQAYLSLIVVTRTRERQPFCQNPQFLPREIPELIAKFLLTF